MAGIWVYKRGYPAGPFSERAYFSHGAAFRFFQVVAADAGSLWWCALRRIRYRRHSIAGDDHL